MFGSENLDVLKYYILRLVNKNSFLRILQEHLQIYLEDLQADHLSLSFQPYNLHVHKHLYSQQTLMETYMLQWELHEL